MQKPAIRNLTKTFSSFPCFLKNYQTVRRSFSHYHILRSSHFSCGQGWIRTTELVRGQIYSLLPLATWLLAPMYPETLLRSFSFKLSFFGLIPDARNFNTPAVTSGHRPVLAPASPDLIRQVRPGATCRNRTNDLLITNQLLYQLS